MDLSGLTQVKHRLKHPEVLRMSSPSLMLRSESFGFLQRSTILQKKVLVAATSFILLSSSGHLTDSHLVEFLRRCQKGLRPNGLIIIKDNVSYEGVVPDEVDSSVCRDLEIVRSLVSRAGLQIVHEEQQLNFPQEIYQVHTLALR